MTDKSNGTQAGINAIGIACDGTITSDTLEQSLHDDAGSNTAGTIAKEIIVRQETNQLHNQGGPPNLAQYDPPQAERPGSSRSSPTRANQRGSTADNLRAFGETPPGTLVGTISRTHIVNGDQVNSATNMGGGRVVNHVNEMMKVGGNEINELWSRGHPKDLVESTVAGSSKTGIRKRKANKTYTVGLKSRAVNSKKIKIKVKNKTVYKSPSSSGTSQVARKPPFRFETPLPTELFKGRADFLNAVRDFFWEVPVNMSNVLNRAIVIAGSAGMGKTEIAYKFAEEFKATFPCVAWINTETAQTTLGSFLRLAIELGIVQPDQENADVNLVKKIYRHIDQEDYGKVLFIFDNAIRFNSSGDDFGLYDYLPTESLVNQRYPYILITTQTHEWGKHIKLLQVEELSVDESVAFFRSAFRVSSAECDEELLLMLDEITEGYPLFMNLVASNIDDNRNGDSVRELQQQIRRYIQEFEKENPKILTEKLKEWPTHYKKTLSAAWKMTFKRLRKAPNGPVALQLLQIMSFLNLPIQSKHIELIWRYNTFDCGNYTKFKEFYYLLERFYAIRILKVYMDNEYDFWCGLGIHRLVQLAVREQPICSRALEFILCFQTLAYSKFGLVNTSALEAALLTKELTWRTLPCVGILAYYGNQVASKIVETRTPKGKCAAATIWRLYYLEKGMTSVSDNNKLQILRELADLTKNAELRTHKLIYLKLTLNLLNGPFWEDFLEKSLQGIIQLLPKLVWESWMHQFFLFTHLQEMEMTRSSVLMKLIKAFVRINAAGALPKIVGEGLAQMCICVDFEDEKFWNGVYEILYSKCSSQSRLAELRTDLWDLGIAKKIIKTFDYFDENFDEIDLPLGFYFRGILTLMDFFLDGMNLMEDRVQELISAFTEMTRRVNLNTSESRCLFVIHVCSVWIKLLLMDSSNEYLLKCLSRCGALALVEGSVEELFVPVTWLMKCFVRSLLEKLSFSITDEYTCDYYPQFIERFSSSEDSRVKALVTFCKKMIDLVYF